MQAKLLDKNRIVFICDDGPALDRVKDICDGYKVRLEPKIIFPVLALPKLARIFPKGWQNIMDAELRTILLDVSNGVRTRRLLLEQYREEYGSDRAIDFDYVVQGKYVMGGEFPPLRHQLTMAKCVATLPRCGLLADPGTCKTAAYLWGIDYRLQKRQIRRALVITLSHLKENVLEEMGVAVPHLHGVVLGGKSDSDRIINKKFKTKKKNLDYDVYIANYESMSGIVEVIPEGFFDVVVLDEAHRIGSPSTNQTKAVVGAFENVPYKYIVTGTLVANNEISFFMPFRFMGPDTVPEADFFCFRSKHFYTVDPDQRIWVAEPCTKDVVRDQITKNAVGFRKEECVDLPGVVYNTIHYDLEGEQAQAYDQAQADLVYIIQKGCSECAFKKDPAFDPMTCMACPNTILIKNALVMVNKLAQICCGFFIETRVKYDEKGKAKNDNIVHWLPENPKLNALISNLNNTPSDRKVIIWSNFIAGIKLICDRIGLAFGPNSFIAVHGDVDAFAAVKRFQDEPDKKYFVANQAKAGTGLNIQFSNYQNFFMNDYSMIKREQAIARQDRQGQTEKVGVTDYAGRIHGRRAIDWEIVNVLNGKKDLATSLTVLAQAAGLDERQYGAKAEPLKPKQEVVSESKIDANDPPPW